MEKTLILRYNASQLDVFAFMCKAISTRDSILLPAQYDDKENTVLTMCTSTMLIPKYCIMTIS